jgi:hypothetical protein
MWRVSVSKQDKRLANLNLVIHEPQQISLYYSDNKA